jgi:hypothetical protein
MPLHLKEFWNVLKFEGEFNGYEFYEVEGEDV